MNWYEVSDDRSDQKRALNYWLTQLEEQMPVFSSIQGNVKKVKSF